MNYLDLLKLGAPEAILVFTALLTLTIGLAARNQTGLVTMVALVGIAASGTAAVLLPRSATLPHGMLVISPLNTTFKLVCLALAFFTVATAQPLRNRPNYAEYVAIILLALVGFMLLVGSEELLMIFIGLELTGLSLYVLTAFDKQCLRSAEAGLKYFLFGSTASAFTLYGLSLIYGMSGTTELALIAQKLSGANTPPLLVAGMVMTLVGFGFKVAAAPFHLWAPDAYEAGPAPSAALIASGSKVASFVALAKVLLVGLAPLHGSAAWHAMTGGWSPLVAMLAAISILVGNFAALAQKNVRRLLAYSAVAHSGYALIGLTAGGDGFAATMFYMTAYAFTLVGAFAVTAVVRAQTGGDETANFTGLFARSPVIAAAMTIFMLSLAGLPPLAGFFGKFYLFSAALRASNNGLLWLVCVALFGSLISLYYYLLILKAVFARGTAAAYSSSAIATDWMQPAAMSLLAAITLLLGVLPDILVGRILAALP